MGEGNDYAWQIGRDESGAFKKKRIIGSWLRRSCKRVEKSSNDVQTGKKIP
jgi:hypothetical protein